MSDWADRKYLRGEAAETGEELMAALLKRALMHGDSHVQKRAAVHILIVDAIEREVSTKMGAFNEGVVLDGDLEPLQGTFLGEHGVARRRKLLAA